jgi:hypothetical protein
MSYNLVPDFLPSSQGGTALTGGYQTGQFFVHSFTVPSTLTSTSATWSFTTNSYSGSEEIIYAVRRQINENSFEDVLNSTNFTGFNSTFPLSTNGGSIALTATNMIAISSSTISVSITQNNLVAGATYFIIARSIYNDTTPQDIDVTITIDDTPTTLNYLDYSLNFPYRGRSWLPLVELIPDANPDGTPLPFSYPLYFQHSFTTPNSEAPVNIIAYLQQYYSLGGDSIVKISKNSVINPNLIGPTTLTTVSPGATMSQNGVNYELNFTNAFSTQLGTGPYLFTGVAFTMTLEPNTKYVIVTKTTSNNNNTNPTLRDMAFGIATDDGTPLGLAYDSEVTSDFIPINQVAYNSNIYTCDNLVPDIQAGTSIPIPNLGSSGTSYYKFRFQVPSTHTGLLNIILKGGTNTAAQSIVSIFDDTNSNTNLLQSATINGGGITADSIFGNIHFIGTRGDSSTIFLNNMIPDRYYNILVRSTLNNTGIDLGGVVISNDSKVTLNHIGQGNMVINGNLFYGENIVPDVYPGTSNLLPDLGAAAQRVFKFNITTPSTHTGDLLMTLNALLPLNTEIIGFYKKDTNVDLLSTNVITGVNMGSIIGPPYRLYFGAAGDTTLTFTGLDAATDYHLIVKTVANAIGSDVSAICVSGSNIFFPSYLETGIDFVNFNIISAFSPLGADIEKDGSSLVNPVPGIAGIRYFKYSIVTPPTHTGPLRINFSNTTTTSSSIVSIYDNNDATATNILTNATTTTGGTITGGVLTINGASNPILTVNNIQSSMTYNMILRVTTNLIGTDLNCLVFSGTNLITLTYEGQGYIYANGIVTNGDMLVQDVYPGTLKPLEYPHIGIGGIRYFKFAFSVNAGPVEMYFRTALSSYNILSIYISTDATSTNILTTATPNGCTITSGTVSFLNNTTPSITFTAASAQYIMIVRSTTNFNRPDLVGIVLSGGVRVPILYQETARMNAAASTPNTWQLTDGISLVPDVTPGANPSPLIYPSVYSNSSAAATATNAGPRIFKFSFTTGEGEGPLYIYLWGSHAIQFSTVLASLCRDGYVDNCFTSTTGNPTSTFVVGTAPTTSTSGTISVAANSFGYLRFNVNSFIVASTKYNLFIRCTANYPGPDIAGAVYWGNSQLSVAYEKQGYLIAPTTSTSGADVSDGLDLLPSTMPNGITPLRTPVGFFGPRFFKYKIVTPSTNTGTLLFNLRVAYNSSSSFSQITTFYKATDPATNLLRTYAVSNGSPAPGTNTSSTGVYTITSNVSGVMSVTGTTLNPITPNTEYHFIIRHNNTNSPLPGELVCLIQAGSSLGPRVPIIYDSTGIVVGANNTLIDYTNLTPDWNPTTLAPLQPIFGLSDARSYKFTFSTSSTQSGSLTMNLSAGTTNNSTITTLYDNSDITKTNLLTSAVFDASPPGGSVTNGVVSVTSNSSPRLTINGILASRTYTFIVSATSNLTTTVDLQGVLYYGSTEVPITYTETGSFLDGTNGNLYDYDNVVPDIFPNGDTIANPAINSVQQRVFRFTFSTPSSITNPTSLPILFRNGSTAPTPQILSMYDNNNPARTNMLLNATASNSAILSNGIITPVTNTIGTITVDVLPSKTYSIVTKVNTNSSGIDLGMLIILNNVKLPLTYVETGHMFMNQKVYELTNLFPPISMAPSNIPTSNAGAYFLHSFVATQTSHPIYAVSDIYTEEHIYKIYKQGSATSLINTTNITNLSGATFSSRDNETSIFIAGTNTGGTQQATPFKLCDIQNLEINARYFISVYTSFNDTGMDKGILIIDNVTKEQLPIRWDLRYASNEEVQKSTAGTPVITSSSFTNNSITVNWNAPTFTGGYSLNNYNVYIKASTALEYPAATASILANVSPLTYTFTGIATGVYDVKITAINLLGESIGDVRRVLMGSPPSQIAKPIVTRLGVAVAAVSFSPPTSIGGSAIIGYKVRTYYNGVEVDIGTDGQTTLIQVPGLQTGRTYTFTVEATNNIGLTSIPSLPSDGFVTATEPSQMAKPSVVRNGSQTVRVSFSAPSSIGSNSITVYRVRTFNSGVEVGSGITGSSSPIDISGLTNGQTYTFKVEATNDAGLTSSSSVASDAIMAAAPPSQMAKPSVARNGDGIIRVSLTAPTQTGGPPIAYYTIKTFYQGAQIRSDDTSSLQFNVPGLINGESYTFKVTATNEENLISLPSDPSDAIIAAIEPSKPLAPSVSRAGSYRIKVDFIAPAANGLPITGYLIEYGTQSFSTTQTSVIIGGLNNGLQYVFTVKAINSAGQSVASDPSNSISPERNWYNIVPNVDKVGISIVADENAKNKQRYFRHSFNSGPNTQLKLFLKTNGTALDEERILSVHKEGATTNLLKPGLDFITFNSGLGYAEGTSSVCATEDNLINNSTSQNALLNVLPNTVYYMIVMTIYNDNVVEDIELTLEDGSDDNRAMTYVSTQLFAYDMYAASGSTATLIGGSILHKNKLERVDGRLLVIESTIPTLTRTDIFTDRAATIERDTQKLLVQSDYDAKVVEVEGRLADSVEEDAVENRMAVLEGRDTALTARVSGIESSIRTLIANTIPGKVTEQTTFNNLRDELRGVDSDLLGKIAGKVVEAAQLNVDALQNTNIGTKLPQTTYDAKMALLAAKTLLQDAAINQLLEDTEFQAKVDALEEYICMVDLAYFLQKPNGEEYHYEGTFQNISFPSGVVPFVYPSV